MPKSTVPIAVVLSLSYSYCRQVLRGIRLYAKDKNWMLYPIVMQPDLRRVLIDSKPAGVIAYAFNQEVARALHGIDLPVVNVSRADPKLTFPQVNIEESSIGTMVAEHLIGCGLRHFGYFGPSRFGPESGREGGFYKGLKRIPHTISVCHTQPSLFDPSDTTGSAENRESGFAVFLSQSVFLRRMIFGGYGFRIFVGKKGYVFLKKSPLLESIMTSFFARSLSPRFRASQFRRSV